MSRGFHNIAVIGAGAWGTALAESYAVQGRRVTIYARDAALALAIEKNHQNNVYLPDVTLHHSIHATSSLPKAVEDADVALLVTPAQYVRHLLTELKPYLPKKTLLVNCAKGIEIVTGKLLSEVTEKILPGHPYAVLSGPSFASEVVKGLPTGVTFATAAPQAEAQRWAQELSSRNLRLYLSADPLGAEIAGAVKNVVAIACGIVEGKGLGQNAKAAVMTRGMAEIKRLGLKKGADAETFLGLSGIGDLTLTCHSLTSRNYSLGVELGKGHSLKTILGNRRHVTEGIHTAKAVADHAHKMQVEMPICTAVNRILHDNASVDEIVAELLARHIKPESF